MRRIINYKYIVLYLIILLATFFMVFYRNIDYAYKAPSRLQNISEDSDMSPEEIERDRKKTFLQHFLDQKQGFSVGQKYNDILGIKTRTLPIVIISTIFLYLSIKNHLVKYNIGRNTRYQREKLKLKRKIALIPPLFSLASIVLLVVIGLLSSNDNFGYEFYFLYDHNSILRIFAFNELASFLVNEVFLFIGIYLLSMLTLELVDRYGKLDGILMFLIMVWVLPIFIIPRGYFNQALHLFLPHNSMILTAPGVNLLKVIAPMIVMILAIFWIRRLKTDEVEV